MLTKKQVLKNFNSKIFKSNDCWIWLASKNVQGYGRFWNGQKLVAAHRFGYELVFGEINANLNVCHKCDNPACVRASHLFLANQKQNVRDCMNKKRFSRPPIHYGEAHHKAKLKLNDVKTIRKLYSSGRFSQRFLANKFNVSQSVIMKIVNNKLWRHVK